MSPTLSNKVLNVFHVKDYVTSIICQALWAGSNPADYVDALNVAADVLARHQRGGSFTKRITFVSDLMTPCDADAEYLDLIAAGMRGAGVQLTVAIAGAADEQNPTFRANREMMERLCKSLNAPGVDGVLPVGSLSKVGPYTT